MCVVIFMVGEKIGQLSKVILFRKRLVIPFINVVGITVLRILYRSGFTSTNVVIKYCQALHDDTLVVNANP